MKKMHLPHRIGGMDVRNDAGSVGGAGPDLPCKPGQPGTGTALLVDATGDFHLWSETYDYEVEDVFLIQEEIAEAVAAQLQVSLGLADGAQLDSPADYVRRINQLILDLNRTDHAGDSG